MNMKFVAIALGLSFVALCARHAQADDDIASQEEMAFKAAVSAIAPSVVRIETFGGSEKVGNVLIGGGPTTGLIVTSDGYVLSSAFNFVQKPSSILVTLPGGKRVAAQIVARDHSRMLVLLKVTADAELPVPAAVPRSEMLVGQWAIAVGRTFEQEQPNISVGVISATDRVWGKAIQADAKISPSNYGGPLIDIHGHVLGILVPMSPQGQGEVAGAEWYDSGIGFAVPLAEILPRLESLQAGKDLHPGLMGISLKNGDANADPAVIVGCHAKGPADKAGFKALDKIVAVDGRAIVRQNQLKHALGGKYAGDVVKVTIERGSERIEKELELVEQLQPYQHPLVGILPLRGPSAAPGVVVRYVLPGSPAAEAQMAAGDRIVAIQDAEIKDASGLSESLAAHAPGEKVSIQYVRAEQTKTVEITLAAMHAEIPNELPAAHTKLAEAQARPNLGLIEVKLPEEKNECVAYIPDSYHPDIPHAVLVALHTPGSYDRDKLVARYKALCEKQGIILLLPRAAEITRWDGGDAAFIKKAIDDLATNYRIDRARVVISGYQASGTMAWAFAAAHHDTFRGVIAVEAALPARLKLPENEPAQRSWFYIASSSKSPQQGAVAATIKRLQLQMYPYVNKDTGATVRDLDAQELSELGRWLDSLDRL